MTLGVGYGIADGEFSDRPTINISGMFRTGKKAYLITENYIISTGYETIGILSFGGRFVGKRIIIDYGGLYSPNSGRLSIIPWLSISVPMWKARR